MKTTEEVNEELDAIADNYFENARRLEPNSSFVVAVYGVNMAFGGREEGGWWYDTGSLVRIMRVFRNEDKACAYCRRLNERLHSRKFGPNQGKRELSSVISDGEYQARLFEKTAPEGFPERRPHYE